MVVWRCAQLITAVQRLPCGVCNPQIIRLNGGQSCPSRINAIIVGNEDNNWSGSTNFTNLLLIMVSPTPQTAFITRRSERRWLLLL